MTDVDIVSHGPVEEAVEEKQSLQTPESQEEDEDDDGDTDTDDGAFGEDEDADDSQFNYHNNRHLNLHKTLIFGRFCFIKCTETVRYKTAQLGRSLN